VHQYFDFRTLKENRRVIKSEDGSEDRKAALENFHHVLTNISEGKATKRVRDFIVQAAPPSNPNSALLCLEGPVAAARPA